MNVHKKALIKTLENGHLVEEVALVNLDFNDNDGIFCINLYKPAEHHCLHLYTGAETVDYPIKLYKIINPKSLCFLSLEWL